MISPPKHSNAHLPSTWAAAITATMLMVGGYGATQPLISDKPAEIFLELGEDTEFVEFQAPGDPAPADAVLEEEEPAEIEEIMEQDLEIPPLPEVIPPLTPPEMPELTPIEEIRPPEPPPAPKPVVEKPKPEPQNKPQPKPRPRATAPSPTNTTGEGTGGGGGSGPPTIFSGRGKGRFPAPSYPAAARRAGIQGTVQVMVVVEASGMPSSVSVYKSSGSSELDASAVSTVQRRWRWPQGNVRRYIVPVRYVLNQAQ